MHLTGCYFHSITWTNAGEEASPHRRVRDEEELQVPSEVVLTGDTARPSLSLSHRRYADPQAQTHMSRGSPAWPHHSGPKKLVLSPEKGPWAATSLGAVSRVASLQNLAEHVCAHLRSCQQRAGLEASVSRPAVSALAQPLAHPCGRQSARVSAAASRPVAPACPGPGVQSPGLHPVSWAEGSEAQPPGPCFLSEERKEPGADLGRHATDTEGAKR